MDNITHSLTGALAAKIFEARTGTPPDRSHQRTLFWLLVLCANLPDIDFVARFFGEPLYPLQFHRGLTHSFVLAPAFALLPAAAAYFLSKLKDFRTLWLAALIGIVLHIFFDLITAFGTQIFAPLTTSRYSLGWMFIIDPLFTGVIAIGLALAKYLPRHRRRAIMSVWAFVILYVSVEMISHSIAENRLENDVQRHGMFPTSASVLAQPLSMFRWVGLVQTREGVMQTFFSVFPREDSIHFRNFSSSNDEFVRRARETEEARWFMQFARHPWVVSIGESGRQVVEFRDLQFSIDVALLQSVGIIERSTPFILRYVFLHDGSIAEVEFDGRTIRNSRHTVTR